MYNVSKQRRTYSVLALFQFIRRKPYFARCEIKLHIGFKQFPVHFVELVFSPVVREVVPHHYRMSECFRHLFSFWRQLETLLFNDLRHLLVRVITYHYLLH